jgi:hypothetical protein
MQWPALRVTNMKPAPPAVSASRCASMELYGGFKGPAISHQHANRVLMKLSCLVRTIGIVQGFFLVRKAQRTNLIFGARFLTMN